LPRSLSHQVGILTLGRVLAYVAAFFVPLVNVRTLTVEEYGYYRQFWLIIETLVPVLILSFPRSLLYYFPRAETEAEKSVYITQTFAFLTAMSVVAFVIYALMAQFLGAGLGALVRGLYWRLSLFTLFHMVSISMDSLFIAEKQVRRQATYQATYTILQALVVIVVSYKTRDVSSIIWGIVGFTAVRFLFVVGYVYRRYRPSLRLVSVRTMRDQLSFAFPLGLASTALLLLTQTDKFVINRFLGREAFAIYAVGAFQVPFVSMIRGSIADVTFPLLSQYQKEGALDKMVDLWKRATLKTAVVFFPLFVLLEIVARPFVSILFTNEYVEATPVFALYLLLFLRSTVELGGIVTAFKQQRYMAKVFGAAVVLNLVLSVALCVWVGRLGVPAATVVSYYVISALMTHKAAILLHRRVRDLLPWKGLTVRFLVAALVGLPLWLWQRSFPIESFVELALAGVLYIGVYFGVCFVTRLVSVPDLKSLISR
jgi:O-antigen/teichoic acid export membrane protein